MCAPSLSGRFRGAGPFLSARHGLSTGSQIGTTATSRTESGRNPGPSASPSWRAGRWREKKPNETASSHEFRKTPAAPAAFSASGRSFIDEFHFKYLEPPENLSRRIADFHYQHCRRSFSAGHHPGRGRNRHSGYAGERRRHRPSGASLQGSGADSEHPPSPPLLPPAPPPSWVRGRSSPCCCRCLSSLDAARPKLRRTL
jgi:hypothetical protein